jgi:DNA polymerase delta subunit 1
MRNVLDNRQIAIKLTANSVYGQCGASTGTFYEIDIASSITATGRLLLTYAKRIIEECLHGIVYTSKEYGDIFVVSEHIYGDTDSVFFQFHMKFVHNGQVIVGQDALKLSIELAEYATNLVSMFLKPPHDFEYEKTFYPFFLFSRKKYVGIKYERDINKGYLTNMGNPLKTRGYCPIVKDVYGGIIDILFNDNNVEKAIQYLGSSLKYIADGNYDIQKLVMTSSLKSSYAYPERVKQKVLADRMTKRDPGNAPSSGDRISFVFIKNNEKLLGNKIETIDFIKQNNLEIDYFYYINKQLFKPIAQLFGLIIEDIWKLKKKHGLIIQHKKDLALIKAEYSQKYKDKPEDELNDIIQDKYNKLVENKIKELLFDDFLLKNCEKQNTITTFFKKKA